MPIVMKLCAKLKIETANTLQVSQHIITGLGKLNGKIIEARFLARTSHLKTAGDGSKELEFDQTILFSVVDYVRVGCGLEIPPLCPANN